MYLVKLPRHWQSRMFQTGLCTRLKDLEMQSVWMLTDWRVKISLSVLGYFI